MSKVALTVEVKDVPSDHIENMLEEFRPAIKMYCEAVFDYPEIHVVVMKED